MKKLFAIFWLATILPACSQIVIPGKTSYDKFLAPFWAQNNNASNTVAGLNANSPIKFSSSLLPDMIFGKSLSGTFYVTNSPDFKYWDGDAADWQTFSFMVTNGVPAGTNTVSRVGAVETLSNKTLQNPILIGATYTNLTVTGTNLAGWFVGNSLTVTNTITASNVWDRSNVKWWGAKGDGVTDDTDEIQAAINSATNSSLEVYLPQGNYLISNSLVIKTPYSFNIPFFFRGVGISSTIITMNNINVPAIIIDGISFGKFSGFMVQGTPASLSHGISLTNIITHNVFENIWISNFGGSGLYFANGLLNWNQFGNSISQGWITTCGDAIGGDDNANGQLTIGPNMEIAFNNNGVNLNGINLHITDSVIEANGYGVRLRPTNGYAINNVTIDNVHFEGQTNANIYLEGGPTGVVNGLSVRNNYFVPSLVTKYSITNSGVLLIYLDWSQNTHALADTIKNGALQLSHTSYGFTPYWTIENEALTSWTLGNFRPTKANSLQGGTLMGTPMSSETYSLTVGPSYGIGIGPEANLTVDIGESTNKFGTVFSRTFSSGNSHLVLDSGAYHTYFQAGAFHFNATTDIAGNLGIGTDSFGTSAAYALAIKNGTAPASSQADMTQLYSGDVSASSEFLVRNEAGLITQLSGNADFPGSVRVANGFTLTEGDLVTKHGGSNMVYLSYGATTNAIIAAKDVTGNFRLWLSTTGESFLSNGLSVTGMVRHSIATGGNANLDVAHHTYLLNVNANVAVLPTAAIGGIVYTIKLVAPAETGSVVPLNASQGIDGAATYSLSASNKFVTVQSDGVTNWWIIGQN